MSFNISTKRGIATLLAVALVVTAILTPIVSSAAAMPERYKKATISGGSSTYIKGGLLYKNTATDSYHRNKAETARVGQMTTTVDGNTIPAYCIESLKAFPTGETLNFDSSVVNSEKLTNAINAIIDANVSDLADDIQAANPHGGYLTREQKDYYVKQIVIWYLADRLIGDRSADIRNSYRAALHDCIDKPSIVWDLQGQGYVYYTNKSNSGVSYTLNASRIGVQENLLQRVQNLAKSARDGNITPKPDPTVTLNNVNFTYNKTGDYYESSLISTSFSSSVQSVSYSFSGTQHYLVNSSGNTISATDSNSLRNGFKIRVPRKNVAPGASASVSVTVKATMLAHYYGYYKPAGDAQSVALGFVAYDTDNANTSKTYSFTREKAVGQVEVTKTDAETGALLAGAEFTLYIGDANSTTVAKNNTGAEIKDQKTGPDGTLSIPNLPVFDSNDNVIQYTLKEVKAPPNYQNFDLFSSSFNLLDGSSSGSGTVTYKISKAVKNLEIVYGEVKIIKVDEYDTTKRLKDAVFTLYEADGKTTAKALNVNNQMVDAVGETDTNGELTFKGLDVYGAAGNEMAGHKYILKETQVPEGYDPVEAITEEFTLKRDSTSRTFEVTANNVEYMEPKIGTTAHDKETLTHLGQSRDKVTIVDTVSYSGLKKNREYTIVGTLMVKNPDGTTGEALKVDGKPVTETKTFTPTERSGTVILEFTFDGGYIPNTSVVVFEKLYYTHYDKTITPGREPDATHEDITDEGQTVTFPPVEIGTTAKDEESGNNTGISRDKVTIIDTVHYSGLVIGKTYTVEGILMEKVIDEETGEVTGKALLVDGKEVTASALLKPETTSGSIDLTFEFDGGYIGGKTIVVFERLYYEGKEYDAHTDIEDEGQTVTFPKPEIGTTAIDNESGTHTGVNRQEITLVDTVSYSGLTIGKQYEVIGTLMDKETGKELLVSGQAVTASAIFTPSAVTGTVEVTFVFDGTDIHGKTIVVFEDVYYKDELFVSHADINDEAQTVEFPEIEIGTSAKNKDDGTQVVQPNEKVTIVDTVFYRNLLVGKEYTVKGTLMEKGTNKPLVANGAFVTAEKTFTAETADGFIELEFTFDARALQGKTVVVFEKLFQEEKEVAVHEDINDIAQTVEVPKVLGDEEIVGSVLGDDADGSVLGEEANPNAQNVQGEESKTGDAMNMVPLMILLLIMSLIVLGVTVQSRTRKE